MKHFLLLLIFLFSFNFLNAQTTRYVNSVTGSDANAGTLAAPYKTFNKAYTVAASGDIINLTGTFDWTAADETGDAAGNGYTIGKNLTVIGQSPSSTFIQAASTINTSDRRVFTLNANITFQNITIRNGKNSGNGGGIYSSGRTLVFTNVAFENNYGVGGGFAFFSSCNVTMTKCTFEGNNSTSYGGAFYGQQCVLTMTNCTLSNNSADNTILQVENYNMAGYELNLTNVTVANNTLTTTSDYHGHVYQQGTAIVRMKNCLFAKNLSPNTSTKHDYLNYSTTAYTVAEYNLIENDYNWAGYGLVNGVNNNIIGNQPSLNLSTTLALNGSSQGTKTLAINCGSPAINAGSSTNNGTIVVPSQDQRDINRSGSPDIGAYENFGTTEMATSGILTAFSKCGSSPSSNQTITVQGCNLSNNISVSAPSGFEISTNASTGFASSLTLTQSGGSVASTTIYIRMTAAASGTVSGNISLTSTGATSVNVAVSGTAASLTVGTASSSQVVCYNANASDIVLSGSSGTIQWQKSTDNSTWTNISSATSATLTAAQIGAVTSTSFIRAQVTSGSCTGNSNTVTLEVNNALAFDGSGDFVNIGNNASLNFTSNFTIESWVYVPASPKYSINTIFSKNYPNNGTPGYMFGFNHWNTTNLYLVLEDAVGGISSNKTVTTGAWNHVAVVISSNGTVGTFYINGSNAGGGTVSLTNASAVNEFIGSMDASGSYSLQGSLDELRIWNVARTQQEIIDNMDNTLTGSESGLVAYYDFDQGIPGGTNTGITSVLNKTANLLNGTFTGISRSGTSSNFVDGNHAAIVSSDYGCVNGNSAKLIVGATGKVPSSIQWYKNTTNSTTGATLIPSATSQTFNTDANESSTKYYYATISGTCAASTNSNIISLQNPVVTGTLDVYEDNTTQLSCSDAAAASSPWVSLNTSLLTTNTSGLITGVYPGTGKVVYTTNAACTDTVNVVVHATEWNGNNSKDISTGSNWKLNVKPSVIKKIRFNNSAANNLILTSKTVVDSIDFGTSNKQIELGDNDLIVNHIKNFNSTRYIKTTGSGKVKKQLTNNASFTFPVGNTSYNPITITNKTGASDSFSINILDTAYLNGASSGIIKNPYVKRTWNISKNTASANAGSGVDISFTWNSNEVVGTLSNPTLNHHNGSGWEIPTMGTSSVSGNTLTYTGYKGTFSPFAIGGSSSIGLEVELLKFDAICKDENIEVSWTTASEKNNDRFELYKSVDAKDWTKIYTIKGQGTKSSETEYLYNDFEKQSSYYRLKDVDFNGKETWSNIVSTTCKDLPIASSIYPNPAIDYVMISTPWEENTTLRILTLSGVILKEEHLISNNNYIEVKGFSPGVYIVEIQKKGSTERLKFLKK